MQAIANLNGQLMPLADVRISAQDRGFLFGDAVYEVLRVYGGKAWLLEAHLRRLARSLEAIRIHGVDLQQLGLRIAETIAAGPFDDATVYIQITRGAAPRGHGFPESAVPLQLISVAEFRDSFADHRLNGAAIITLPDNRWGRCDIKSTNLLANVLAVQTAKEMDAIEAVFYLPDGLLTEGGHTSFFAVLNGVVRTAPPGLNILPGVTREFVLDLLRENAIPAREEAVTRMQLSACTELFLTGTTAEVLPIVRVDNEIIAAGRPGPITRQLQHLFRTAVHSVSARKGI